MSLMPFTTAPTASPRAFANASDRALEVAGTPTPRTADRARERAAGSPAREPVTTRADRANAERARPDRARDDEARASRSTPPDFAALMALLAISAAREAQELRETRLPDLEEAGPAADASLAGDTPVTESDAEALAANAASETEPAEGAPSAHLADLSARVRTESLTTARRLLAETARLDAREDGGREETALFAAVADRARRGNMGDLLARGDRAAAGVRGALDALLDAAGTARGRAMAEAMRPEFAEAVARSADDVSTAVRDVDALAPAFRVRLDRVIERMRDEFGHDVQIIETVRSTDRQEHLFAQGRTRPGAVVTWTRDSAHLSGEAADVLIDGTWQNPQGWARLHAIAEQEGLRTLGMRDPGHLELRGSGAAGDHASHLPVHGAEPGARPAPARDAHGVAQVAAVAGVAQVAQQARVAAVARAGATGLARAAERTGREPATPAPSATDGLPSTASRTATVASAQAAARQGDTGSGSSDRDRSSREQRAAVTLDSLSAVGTLSPSAARVLEGGLPRVQVTPGSDAAARAEGIAVLREDAPVRAIDSLTLQLDTPEGPEQVRVSLRGGVVGAQVSTGNAALADRLRLQTADLQDALGRHGLETETVSVRQTSRVSDSDAVRLAAAERGETLRAAGAQTGQQGAFDQGPRDRATARPDRDARQGAGDDSTSQRRRDDRQEQR